MWCNLFDASYRNQSKITRQLWQQRKKQQQKNQLQRKSNNIRYFLSYIFFIFINILNPESDTRRPIT